MSIGRNMVTVAVGTTISRILGFLRDILIAATLGSGPIADAFVVAFRLPNLFRRLLAEGAFNPALVPLYGRRLRDDEKSAHQFVGEIVTTAVMLLVGLTLVVEWYVPVMVSLLAPGFIVDENKFDLTVKLSRAAFPFLAMASLAAIFADLLNAMRRFAAAALAIVALNVVLVTSLFAIQTQHLAGTAEGATWLCWSVSAAGFVQLVVCCAGARWAGIPIGLRWPRVSPASRRLLSLSIPGLIIAGVAQVNGFVGSFVGSSSASVVSYLYFADRLYQLPLGIVGTAIGLVLLPNLNRQLLDGNELQARGPQTCAFEFSLFLILPAAVALTVSAQPIVTVLFERGAFNSVASSTTAAAVAAYAIGLPRYIIAKALQPAYFARQDVRAPVIIALVGAAADFAIALALFVPWAQVGIALAAAAAGWINAAGLVIILCRRDPLAFNQLMIRRIVLLLFSAAAMGAVLRACAWTFAPLFALTEPLVVKSLALVVLCAVGLTTYLATAWLVGAVDFKTAWRSVPW